jgi:hypothetical protein
LKTAKPTTAAKKAAIKGYLALAGPMVSSNKSAVSAFNSSICKLWEDKRDVKRSVKELFALKKPPAELLDICKLAIMVMGGRAGKGMGFIGATWEDIRKILGDGDYGEALKSGFEVGMVVWGMGAAAVRRKVEDFAKDGREAVVERMYRRSAFGKLLAEAVFEARGLWDGLVGDKKEVSVGVAAASEQFEPVGNAAGGGCRAPI